MAGATQLARRVLAVKPTSENPLNTGSPLAWRARDSYVPGWRSLIAASFPREIRAPSPAHSGGQFRSLSVSGRPTSQSRCPETDSPTRPLAPRSVRVRPVSGTRETVSLNDSTAERGRGATGRCRPRSCRVDVCARHIRVQSGRIGYCAVEEPAACHPMHDRAAKTHPTSVDWTAGRLSTRAGSQPVMPIGGRRCALPVEHWPDPPVQPGHRSEPRPRRGR